MSLIDEKKDKTLSSVGVFNDSFPPILDGVTLTVENYARILMKRGISPVLVTPWNPVRVETPYEVKRFFSTPIRSRFPYRYGYPKLDPWIWRDIRNLPIQLAHSHCPFSSGRLALYAKKKNGIPVIGTFHSKYRDDLAHSFSRTPWMVDIIMKKILSFFESCDEVWIPQAAVEETVREYGFKGPLVVMPNGSDFSALSGEELVKIKKDARAALGFREDEIGLLFVGQHIIEKGIDVIADALALLDGKLKFRMDFIGDGYAAKFIRDRIAELGLSDRVHFHGVLSDRDLLRKHYAAADLFLFPSMYDNAPLVVREAASVGTPAIIPIGSTASEVIDDGVNGYLAERSAKAYSDRIIGLAANRDALVKTGENAGQSFVMDWDSVMDEVVSRYEHLVRTYRK